MNNSHDLTDLIRKTTVTFSCPLQMAAWLRHTQRNCSAYIVEVIEAKRKSEEEKQTDEMA